MTAVVSVINYKGGLGKTTLTANIGAELAVRGRTVLLVDLDPQASLTSPLSSRMNGRRPSLMPGRSCSGSAACLKARPTRCGRTWSRHRPSTRSSRRTGLSAGPARFPPRPDRYGPRPCLPAGRLALPARQSQLPAAAPLTSRRVCRRRVRGVRRDPARLRSELHDGDAYRHRRSDYLLMPAKPDYLSMLGIDYLRRTLSELVRDYNKVAPSTDGEINPAMLGIVFAMIQYGGRDPIRAMRTYLQHPSVIEIPVRADDPRQQDVIRPGRCPGRAGGSGRGRERGCAARTTRAGQRVPRQDPDLGDSRGGSPRDQSGRAGQAR